MAKEIVDLRAARQMWWHEIKTLQITKGLPVDFKAANDAIERLNKEIADADAADGLTGP